MTGFRRIGGPNAISSWTFLLTVVVFAIATLLPTSRDEVTGPAEARLAVAMLATAAAFVLLVVARLTVLRAGDRPARPWVALAVFALAGVVQAVALIGLRPRLDLAPIDPALLILTRAVAGVVWLSIVAILVDEVRSHNARVAELVARIDALRAVREREEREREAAVEALRDETLEPLRVALDAIGAQLGGGDAQAEADRVRRLVEDEVRPASHALLEREADALVPSGSIVLARRERMRLILRLATSSLAAPTWLAVGLPLVIVLLFAVQDVGVLFVVAVSAAYVVLMALGFGLGRRLLEPRLERMPVAAAAGALLATYEVLAVVAVVNNWAWGFLSPLGRWIEWPTLFVLPTIWIGLALSRAAQAKREETQERLAGVLADLAAAEARRRQMLRHEYQTVGRLLHGEVQGALLAVARRLEDGGDVDEAAEQLRRLAERISSGVPEMWTAERALADIVDLWGGVADVRLACDPAILDRVDAAPATRTTLIDVVAEAVTNAVRHGSAETIAVRIVEADDQLAVEVDDDGRATARGAPGMGTQLFDAVSPAWTLDTGADGARLRVAVVLDGA